jgi:alpha-N-arabinofuranosidase
MKSTDRRLHWAYRLLLLAVVFSCLSLAGAHAAATAEAPGVAVLLVDTDRVTGTVEEAIYGQFLEHINHSVVDGLFAEQIQGRGFEGQDFGTYWVPFGENGSAATADVRFENGEKSVRLQADHGTAGIRQGRISILQGQQYNGSVWIKREAGALQLTFRVMDSGGREVAAVPLGPFGSEWREVGYSFSSPRTDAQARVEIVAAGTGAVLLDYISMMRADVRTNGMLRPDLLDALRALKPPFIRWPGGSFASEYLWKDGIGPVAARKFHPNRVWGGYSDYYSFGTDEFMELCRQLKAEPLIVLPAPGTDPAQIQYAMDWVHYLNDPPTTEWGRRRAANGHAAPYDVRYFQIDNEPMNFELSPDRYAEIVNAYGSQLRKIAPEAKIVACGQKRSNDMNWSQKVVDLAGDNFDILGSHNYEYENDNFETGIRRIQDYLVRLRDYIRASRHPQIKIAVLEWNLCRTYDWRAGLHAAGSLIAYEKLSPDVAMTCPALLMRNTTDDPEWRAWIYHDHVSWFPGSGYVVEKLFREHYAEKYLASATGTFRDVADRGAFFDGISQMKPEAWRPGALDAIATRSTDGRRIVIKAVNYEAQSNTLLVRLQGSAVPEKAAVRAYTLTAGLTDAPSMEQPGKIHPVETTVPYARTLTIEMKPHSVAVVEMSRTDR